MIISGVVVRVGHQGEDAVEEVVEVVVVKLVGECILVVEVEEAREVKVDRHHHKVEPEVVWLVHHMLVKVLEGHQEEARI